MNWKQWFARDSVVWAVLFYVGLIAGGLSTLTDPTAYGIPLVWMPYIKLIALIAAIVGGKMGLSFAGKKSNLEQ